MSPRAGAIGRSILSRLQARSNTVSAAWPRATAITVPIIFRIWCIMKL